MTAPGLSGSMDDGKTMSSSKLRFVCTEKFHDEMGKSLRSTESFLVNELSLALEILTSNSALIKLLDRIRVVCVESRVL